MKRTYTQQTGDGMMGNGDAVDSDTVIYDTVFRHNQQQQQHASAATSPTIEQPVKKSKKGKKKSGASSSSATTPSSGDVGAGGDQQHHHAKKAMSDDQLSLRTTKQYFTANSDFSGLELKSDHALRPCWVLPNYHIFLETFSPIYRQAYDFLVAVAEPVSRPEHLHEYCLTDYSLYAAVSIGLETEQIIQVLDKLSKVALSEEVRQFVISRTSSYGKVNLVLQRNIQFVESPHKEILLQLLNEPSIAATAKLAVYDRHVGGRQFVHGMQIDPDTGLLIRSRTSAEMNAFELATQNNTVDAQAKNARSDKEREEMALMRAKRKKDLITEVTEAVSANIENPSRAIGDDDDDDDDYMGAGSEVIKTSVRLYCFEIESRKVEDVKKKCIELNLPMLEEYDFRRDTVNEKLEIDLKPTTVIRSYQEKSLSKMFGNGRARSGIIVLPCGAGKTLVGITACCTVKKATLVLCISAVSVEQWKKQFQMWTTVPEDRIKTFTSENKERLSAKGADVLIATYNMITYTGNRNQESKRVMEEITNREWGLMLLDEVHVAPADSFRKVIGLVKAHCSLGLTATLLREDNKTDDIYFLIGPKLYEANWLDLQSNGHLARVQCIEVWCPMTPEFYREYLQQSMAIKKLLYVMNPNKFRACEFLIRKHEERGDKIIVFSDNVFALKEYAMILKKPFIYGETKEKERRNVLSNFQNNPRLNCVFISKVGDTAIDLPEANVIIQISSHFGSRRQEAQRLGRILRPKKDQNESSDGSPNAFFYSLVSQDTSEMFYSTKRQQFLINQGYSFRVLTDLFQHTEGVVQFLKTKQEELDMLRKVVSADQESALTENLKDEGDGLVDRQVRNTLRNLSGASGDQMYLEYNRGGKNAQKNAQLNARNYTGQHVLFRKFKTAKGTK